MSDYDRTQLLGPARTAFDSGETLPADGPLQLGPSSPALRLGTRVDREASMDAKIASVEEKLGG